MTYSQRKRAPLRAGMPFFVAVAMATVLSACRKGAAPADRVIVAGLQKIFFPGALVKASEVVMGALPTPPAALSATVTK